MKRIVFLDYVRIFACFLVMVVHASENFYGAAGSTDMVGPQSYIRDRQVVGICIRRIFTYVGSTFYDCVCFSSCSDEGRTEHVAVLSSSLYAHIASVLDLYGFI